MLLRLAVTGRKASPPLFETMEVLGKEITRRRLRRAAELVAQAAWRSEPAATARCAALARRDAAIDRAGAPIAAAGETVEAERTPARRRRRGRARPRGRSSSWSPCAVSLTLQEYIGERDVLQRHCSRTTRRRSTGSSWGFAWWSGWRVLGYVVIPMIVILLLPGERLRDYHVSLARLPQAPVDLRACCSSLHPAGVIAASTTAAFRHTYPFYKLANRSPFDLWAWEALYAVAVPLARVLLPRLPAARRCARALGAQRDLRDDRAVLHDPLRQADARDARRDRRRPRSSARSRCARARSGAAC